MQNQQGGILARQVARELNQEELNEVGGGTSHGTDTGGDLSPDSDTMIDVSFIF